MTCITWIISRGPKKEEEVALYKLKDAAKREEAPKKLIDRELEEIHFRSEDILSEEAKNPNGKVLNK